MREILSKSSTLRGLIYSEFAEQYYVEFLREVAAGIADGRIRYCEDIADGLDKVLKLLSGWSTGNFAKVIVSVGMLPDDV
jgi:NADPH-dependent curcumin reductase CurA